MKTRRCEKLSFILVIYVVYSMLEEISVYQLQLYFRSEVLKISCQRHPAVVRFLFFFVYTTLIQGLEEHRRTPALFAINSHLTYSGNSHFVVALHANKF